MLYYGNDRDGVIGQARSVAAVRKAAGLPRLPAPTDSEVGEWPSMGGHNWVWDFPHPYLDGSSRRYYVAQCDDMIYWFAHESESVVASLCGWMEAEAEADNYDYMEEWS